ncbi:RabGAP/TBC [Ganoderma leucocontextum]|nr:RabGAP/TBC [Ganoderma leucocontextum]
MGEPRHRPDVKEIKDAYDHLFNAGHKAARLKDAALAGQLFQGAESAAGVAGRSMALEGEPLHDVADVEATPPRKPLRSAREDYQRLLMDKMRAPDGGYEEGFTVPGSGASPPRSDKGGGNLEKNNPLSLDDENPWREWFASAELRKTILQDVERTFPDIPYFRDAEVQAELTHILYLYSDMHPDIGYRQGMHELLAPLYYAVDYDSISDDCSTDPVLKEFCSRSWVAADAWCLFSAVMKGTGRWYEWQENKTPAMAETTPLPSHVQVNVAVRDSQMKPYIAPIVEAANRVQSVLLKGVDPELWKALQTAGIEPQIYGIRWLRLLFTRELSLDDAMVLWDALFAVDPSFDLALWICVAMLVRIRNKLIPSDYSTQLTYLLRYPNSPPAAGGNVEPSAIHPAILLIRQALTLQMSPTPTVGVSIIHENRNLLGIPTEVPPPISPPVHRRQRQGERGRSFANGSASGSVSLMLEPGSRGAHSRQGSSPLGLPETFARNLLERGESLGINKTVMNAVSELKKNLPDIATALGRLPLTPQPGNVMYPMSPERPVGERPPWEPRTRNEMEREVTQVRALQKRLGDTVGWIVDTLLLDEGDGKDDTGKKTIQKRKREALESLAYVRDILKGTVDDIDEERLVGEEEGQRRRDKERREREAAEALSRKTSTPHPPMPAASIPIEGRPQGTGVRRSQESFMPHGSSSHTPTNPPPAPVVAHPPGQPSRPPPLCAVPSLPASQSFPLPVSPQATKPPNSNLPTFNAPWNYTRSAFSSSDSPIANLPRVPPRTSTVLPRPSPTPNPLGQALKFRNHPQPPPSLLESANVNGAVSRDQKPKQTPYDPLGAIP